MDRRTEAKDGGAFMRMGLSHKSWSSHNERGVAIPSVCKTEDCFVSSFLEMTLSSFSRSALILILLFISFPPVGYGGNGVEIPLDDFSQFSDGYRIQIGAYSSEASAQSVIDTLHANAVEHVQIRYADQLWRVRVGAFADSSAAASYNGLELIPLGFYNSNIIRDKIKPSSSSSESKKVDGYRVQVKALAERGKALEYGRKMDFNDPGIRAYVIYEDDIYKIHLGDFTKRGEAEQWKVNYNQVEQTEAWIVTTKVYVNPSPSPIDRPEADPFDYMD